MRGRKLLLPQNPALRPRQDLLEWHNQNVFLG